MMTDFKPPFSVHEGTIYDAEGRKVKLWGVNYYAPFNHNFYNMEELGRDQFAAIDEDFRHFKLMGVRFIRMHLYDREISDREGNVVENKNMRVFDYFIEKCHEDGIFLMLTPTVWWNTVSNQIHLEKQYAYWYIDSQDAFGFSNFFSCDAMLWDPDAIRCQEIYLNALFSRKNRFSGKTLAEYPNIVTIELFNEPQFPSLDLIHREPDSKVGFSAGKQRQKLIALWDAFRAGHPEAADEGECFRLFHFETLRHYFECLWPIVGKYFGKNVIRAQFSSYSGKIPQELVEMYENCGIDALTLGTYLNVNGFEAQNNDGANHLDLAEKWFQRISADKGKLARISYEFDATSTLNAYPLAAIAAMYAKYDVQMAAFFTYTPSAVAAWNPGWLIHYLNIAHTPARAAGFTAAGEIFRTHNPKDEITMETESWRGNDYLIDRLRDLVEIESADSFCYSGNTETDVSDFSKLRHISGRGNSPLAESSGNGCYFLNKVSDSEWRLTLFPNQKYVGEPCRGKTFRFMANRYVDCLKEPPVSILLEERISFRIKKFRIESCRCESTGKAIPVEDGGMLIPPGTYLLKVRS